MLERLWYALAPNDSPRRGTPVAEIERLFHLVVESFPEAPEVDQARRGFVGYTSWRRRWVNRYGPPTQAECKNAWKRWLATLLLRARLFREMPPGTPAESAEDRYYDDRFLDDGLTDYLAGFEW